MQSQSTATSLAAGPFAPTDFRSYLEQSLRNPFTLDLKDCNLVEVVLACVKAKSKLHPNYRSNISSLLYNLRALESEYRVTLYPIQVTDIFWGYFVGFCQGRGLRSSSIETMCNQLRSVLNWAVKYNATASPTYNEINFHKTANQKIALTADEVSRVTYFDIQLFYADRRHDFRETMEKVRDMFVLSCNLGQRHSDMVRISPSCFERNIFRISQQKTGNLAVVNIDKYAIDAKTTYRILEKYGYCAPYRCEIGNYNGYLHLLLKDVGLNETVRLEEKRGGKMVVENVPKWKMVSSHTARRTFITINVLRGNNIHDVKRCSGHSDLRCLEQYVRDE